jgi:hypothetical protein
MITLTLLVLVASAAMAGPGDTNVAHQTIGVTIPVMRVAGVDADANLTILAPTVAGTPPLPAVSDPTYLRYTSVWDGTHKAAFDASVVGVPVGTNLALLSGYPTGSGATGDLGTVLAYGAIPTLDATHRRLINAIGSGFTGRGAGDGASLVYTLTITDWTQVRAAITHPTVTFTMTDN